MKRVIFIISMIAIITMSGCTWGQKHLYTPEATNDKTYTTVGMDEKTYHGDGYAITIPEKIYLYEKDYDDGNMEEKWEYTKKDDVEIKVTTYKNTDEITARGKFLRENNDYIFEDLTGYSLCGMEPDGDTLWFNLHIKDDIVYIVSWEYPHNTKDDLKRELADIAATFELTE